MSDELFDYSNKNNEELTRILRNARFELLGHGPLALQTKVCESAYAELKKRGIKNP